MIKTLFFLILFTTFGWSSNEDLKEAAVKASTIGLTHVDYIERVLGKQPIDVGRKFEVARYCVLTKHRLSHVVEEQTLQEAAGQRIHRARVIDEFGNSIEKSLPEGEVKRSFGTLDQLNATLSAAERFDDGRPYLSKERIMQSFINIASTEVPSRFPFLSRVNKLVARLPKGKAALLLGSGVLGAGIITNRIRGIHAHSDAQE